MQHSHFGLELAEVIHNEDIGGCTIRHYNQETGSSLPGWSPHCADMLHEHSTTTMRERLTTTVRGPFGPSQPASNRCWLLTADK